MSVVLATRYSDRVEMAVDGGEWNASGIFIGRRDKLIVAPDLPLAVSGVGTSEALQSLGAFVIASAKGKSVDETIAELELTLPERDEITSPLRWELVIACFSETKGPQIWRIRSLLFTDTRSPELVPSLIDFVAFGPELTSDELQACGWRTDDFIAGLIEQFEAMRAKRGVTLPELMPGVSMAPAHYVGAHVDHAVITADGVTVERVKEWPDVVGEMIRPDGSGHSLPAPATIYEAHGTAT